MKGNVIRLCNLSDIAIPDEFLTATVDEAEVDRQVQALCRRYAAQLPVQQAQQGDIVYCRADGARYGDGRTVMLYTALDIPGAEEATQAALGKTIGARFSTVLCGAGVQLTVEKIIRPVPAQLDDGLIASIGLEGVNTVADYRAYMADKMLSECRMEHRKMAVSHVMERLIEDSEFSYSPADLDATIAEEMDEIIRQCQEAGMELPTREELRSGMLYQAKQGWAAAEYCRANGIRIDREAVEAEADQMLEMMALMGEPVPSREKMLESAMVDACVTELFGAIDALVAQKMGR